MELGIIIDEDLLIEKEKFIKDLAYCRNKKKFYRIQFDSVTKRIINPDKIIAIDFLEENGTDRKLS